MLVKVVEAARSTDADDLVQALGPILGRVFEAAIHITASVPLPQSAYNASRHQYLSTMLLDGLAPQKLRGWDRLLGFTDVDLYAPDLNFVLARQMSNAVWRSSRWRGFILRIT